MAFFDFNLEMEDIPCIDLNSGNIMDIDLTFDGFWDDITDEELLEATQSILPDRRADTNPSPGDAKVMVSDDGNDGPTDEEMMAASALLMLEPAVTKDKVNVNEIKVEVKEEIKSVPTQESSFAKCSEEDLIKIEAAKDEKSTKASTGWGVRRVKEWCRERGFNPDFELLPSTDIATMLRQFYGEVRKQDGEEYSKNGLTGIRAAIHRYLTAAPFHRTFNILKDADFKAANNVLLGCLKVNKRIGKNKTRSYLPVSPEDMRLLFTSGILSTGSPSALQNLVWFSTQFYFCRRGCEGVQDLRKDAFNFNIDSAGKEYVQLAYNEASKNHPGGFADTNDPIRKMYATGGPLCPVNSLRIYLTKLNPNSEALYQQVNPHAKHGDECWYLPAKVGIKKLNGMMAKLSLEAKLSRRYTNHCLRATCITTLMNNGFDALTVTRLSGHRNLQSVLSYCKDVGDDTKRQMGKTLTQSLTGSCSPLQQLQPQQARQSSSNIQLQAQEQQPSPSSNIQLHGQQPSSSIHLQRQDNNASMFANCSIGSIQVSYFYDKK